MVCHFKCKHIQQHYKHKNIRAGVFFGSPCSFSLSNKMAILRRDPPPQLVRWMQGVWKHNFRPIYRFISEMMQDSALVTIPKLSNGTSLNDPEWSLNQIQGHGTVLFSSVQFVTLLQQNVLRGYSTSNNSKKIQDRAIFTMPDQ